MNIFVGIMLVFAAIGLLDEILNGRFGLAVEFEKGLATMGSLALSTIGFYCVGVASVQSHAESISALTNHMPFDPSLIIGCILAPDMGALPIAQKLSGTDVMGVFTGCIIASGLGMTISFQLPVFLASVKKQEVSELMQGFIFGLITLPVGILIGGLGLKIPVRDFLINILPVLVLCLGLIGAFALAPKKTTKVLIIFGMLIRIFSYCLFGVVIFGVFLPDYALVDNHLVEEMMYLIVRMVIVACGGLVLSKIALKKLKRPIDYLGKLLGINEKAVVGLFLSCTQSLAMLPLYSQMDRKGKIMNAAFSVCGAYVVGGQMAFVASLIPGHMVTIYIISKIVAGGAAIIVASFFSTKQKEIA